MVTEVLCYRILLLLIILVTAKCISLLQHTQIDANGTLRDIPGPLLARYTPFWLAYQARVGRRYIAVHELHQVGRSPPSPIIDVSSVTRRNTAHS